MAALLLAFSFLSFLKGLLMFLFITSAILLIVIVLLQEPKGGGLASAFGGMGAETFGVKTGGVNKFTSIVAGLFMVIAILYAAIREEGERSLLEISPTVDQAPAVPAPPPPALPPPDSGTGEQTPPPGDAGTGD